MIYLSDSGFRIKSAFDRLLNQRKFIEAFIQCYCVVSKILKVLSKVKINGNSVHNSKPIMLMTVILVVIVA